MICKKHNRFVRAGKCPLYMKEREALIKDIINAERENYKIGKEISKLEKENETIDE